MPTKPRVLVIEDDAQMKEVLCAMLVMKGYAVACTPTLAGAFAILTEGRMGSTVLDLRLPDSTMPQTIARIRELKSKGAGRVVAITGVVLTSEWSEMIELAGADEVVEKVMPYFPERLLKAIGK